MLEQRIHNRRPGPLEGLVVVALAVLTVIAASVLFSLLAARLGAISTALFIAFGAAVTWFLLDRYALGFVYTASADCLRVSRSYGKRERFMTDVWLNQVLAWGTPEEIRQRFPNARFQRATRPQCDLKPLALAYRDGDRTAAIVLQPDEAMRKHLVSAIRAVK